MLALLFNIKGVRLKCPSIFYIFQEVRSSSKLIFRMSVQLLLKIIVKLLEIAYMLPDLIASWNNLTK